MKRRGWIRAIHPIGFPAGKAYRVKTTRLNEQGQSEVSSFVVVGWVGDSFISVVDNDSLDLLAWDVKPDMTAHSIKEVVQQAVERTGMDHASGEDRTRLLNDRGSGVMAGAFEDDRRLLPSATWTVHPLTRQRTGSWSASLTHSRSGSP